MNTSRKFVSVVVVLGLAALGAAPVQSCGSLPGGGGSNDGGPRGGPCGNGRVDGLEECEGNATDSESVCRTFGAPWGYTSGTARCDPNTCTWNLRACKRPVCGDGRIEGGETCEPRIPLADNRCYAGAGEVRCDPEGCFFDHGDCRPPTCGNGKIDHEEENCDGADLGGATCASLGYSGSTAQLGCSSNCTFDRRACAGASSCGNGVFEPDLEECDGKVSCQEYARRVLVKQGYPADYYEEGDVYCEPNTCTARTHMCRVSTSNCGNGILEPQYKEQCDGKDFGGATCASYGFLFGELRCSSDCRLVPTAGCTGGCVPSGRGIYCQ
jgi:hypothetical protein